MSQTRATLDMFSQRRLGNMIIRDRKYRVGDVIRWIPSYAMFADEEERGLGIVVEASDDSRMIKAYWTGDKKIREIDTFLMVSNFLLQDYAPIPQVAEAIVLARAEGLVVEENYCERVL